MTWFAPLLPETAVSIEATGRMWEIGLLPDEAKYVLYAVDKRRREFTAGRNCAREGLRRLGLEPAAIPVGPMRAPVFPPGVSGSITHTGDYCAAAIIRRGDVLSIGIDAETNQCFVEDAPGFCTSEECSAVAELAQGSSVNWFGIIFSAKESFYKAWFQLYQTYLDFQDVTIHFHPQLKEFSMKATRSDAAELMRVVTFVGRYVCDAHLICTAVTAVEQR